jgi:hypothetical protein
MSDKKNDLEQEIALDDQTSKKSDEGTDDIHWFPDEQAKAAIREHEERVREKTAKPTDLRILPGPVPAAEAQDKLQAMLSVVQFKAMANRNATRANEQEPEIVGSKNATSPLNTVSDKAAGSGTGEKAGDEADDLTSCSSSDEDTTKISAENFHVLGPDLARFLGDKQFTSISISDIPNGKHLVADRADVLTQKIGGESGLKSVLLDKQFSADLFKPSANTVVLDNIKGLSIELESGEGGKDSKTVSVTRIEYSKDEQGNSKLKIKLNHNGETKDLELELDSKTAGAFRNLDALRRANSEHLQVAEGGAKLVKVPPAKPGDVPSVQLQEGGKPTKNEEAKDSINNTLIALGMAAAGIGLLANRKRIWSLFTNGAERPPEKPAQLLAEKPEEKTAAEEKNIPEKAAKAPEKPGTDDGKRGLLDAGEWKGRADAWIKENPLRMLEIAKELAISGGKLDPELEAAFKANADLLKALLKSNPDAVRNAVTEILNAPTNKGLDVMMETGLMRAILPEVADLKPQTPLEELRAKRQALLDRGEKLKPEHFDKTELHNGPHPEGDAWSHTKLVLEQVRKADLPAAEKAKLLWAALLHDAGLPATQKIKTDKDGNVKTDKFGNAEIINPGHDAKGAELTKEIVKRFGFDEKTASLLTDLVAEHMNMHQAGGDKIRGIKNAHPDTFQLFRELAKADSMGTGLQEDKRVEKATKRQQEIDVMLAEKVEAPKPEKPKTTELVKAEFLMKEFGIKPGPDLGKALKEAREAQERGEFKDQQSAEAWARKKFGKPKAQLHGELIDAAGKALDEKPEGSSKNRREALTDLRKQLESLQERLKAEGLTVKQYRECIDELDALNKRYKLGLEKNLETTRARNAEKLDTEKADIHPGIVPVLGRHSKAIDEILKAFAPGAADAPTMSKTTELCRGLSNYLDEPGRNALTPFIDRWTSVEAKQQKLTEIRADKLLPEALREVFNLPPEQWEKALFDLITKAPFRLGDATYRDKPAGELAAALVEQYLLEPGMVPNAEVDPVKLKTLEAVRDRIRRNESMRVVLDNGANLPGVFGKDAIVTDTKLDEIPTENKKAEKEKAVQRMVEDVLKKQGYTPEELARVFNPKLSADFWKENGEAQRKLLKETYGFTDAELVAYKDNPAKFLRDNFHKLLEKKGFSPDQIKEFQKNPAEFLQQNKAELEARGLLPDVRRLAVTKESIDQITKSAREVAGLDAKSHVREKTYLLRTVVGQDHLGLPRILMMSFDPSHHANQVKGYFREIGPDGKQADAGYMHVTWDPKGLRDIKVVHTRSGSELTQIDSVKLPPAEKAAERAAAIEALLQKIPPELREKARAQLTENKIAEIKLFESVDSEGNKVFSFAKFDKNQKPLTGFDVKNEFKVYLKPTDGPSEHEKAKEKALESLPAQPPELRKQAKEFFEKYAKENGKWTECTLRVTASQDESGKPRFIFEVQKPGANGKAVTYRMEVGEDGKPRDIQLTGRFGDNFQIKLADGGTVEGRLQRQAQINQLLETLPAEPPSVREEARKFFEKAGEKAANIEVSVVSINGVPRITLSRTVKDGDKLNETRVTLHPDGTPGKEVTSEVTRPVETGASEIKVLALSGEPAKRAQQIDAFILSLPENARENARKFFSDPANKDITDVRAIYRNVNGNQQLTLETKTPAGDGSADRHTIRQQTLDANGKPIATTVYDKSVPLNENELREEAKIFVMDTNFDHMNEGLKNLTPEEREAKLKEWRAYMDAMGLSSYEAQPGSSAFKDQLELQEYLRKLVTGTEVPGEQPVKPPDVAPDTGRDTNKHKDKKVTDLVSESLALELQFKANSKYEPRGKLGLASNVNSYIAKVNEILNTNKVPDTAEKLNRFVGDFVGSKDFLKADPLLAKATVVVDASLASGGKVVYKYEGAEITKPVIGRDATHVFVQEADGKITKLELSKMSVEFRVSQATMEKAGKDPWAARELMSTLYQQLTQVEQLAGRADRAKKFGIDMASGQVDPAKMAEVIAREKAVADTSADFVQYTLNDRRLVEGQPKVHDKLTSTNLERPLTELKGTKVVTCIDAEGRLRIFVMDSHSKATELSEADSMKLVEEAYKNEIRLLDEKIKNEKNTEQKAKLELEKQKMLDESKLYKENAEFRATKNAELARRISLGKVGAASGGTVSALLVLTFVLEQIRHEKAPTTAPVNVPLS